MASKISFSAIIAALLFLAIAPASNYAHRDSSIPFSYTGKKDGSANWGDLSPEFRTCSKGQMQSPININKNETIINKSLKPFAISYKPANATLITNGMGVGVHFEGDAGYMTINDTQYPLKQLHWHTPSEHTINGERYALELHLVHQLEGGNLSVIGILYKYGKPNEFISEIQESLKKLAEETKKGKKEAQVPIGSLNAKLFLKNYDIDNKSYRYGGSLTTPPCSQDVIWNIYPRIKQVTKEQVEAFKAPLDPEYKVNSRPVQSLNGRKVEITS